MTRVIATMGYTALRVKDFDTALSNATEIMGMRESSRTGDSITLTHGEQQRSSMLVPADADGVDHIALHANGPEGLAEIRTRLREEGILVLRDGPQSDEFTDGLRFVGPDGYEFEVYTGMRTGEPAFTPTGVRPRRFGHVNIFTPKPDAMVAFLERILDFRVSDYLGEGAFLRCNSDHHGIAVAPADSARLHHSAWEVESIADLGRLGDVLNERGQNLIWGPVRHGIGRNIAAYFVEPSGHVVEYYTDMQRIENEEVFVPGRWEQTDPDYFSLWWQMRPEGFREHGVAPASSR
jgi:catechol 2,3-dioxygenase